MGLFRKSVPREVPSLEERLGGDPKEMHDKLHATLFGFVTGGLGQSALDSPELRSELDAALSALIWESFYQGDLNLVRLLQRVCASYGVVDDSKLTDEEWGEWLFDDITPVHGYLQELLAAGKPNLERNLSLLATTPMKMLEMSPRFESVMREVQAAARRYSES